MVSLLIHLFCFTILFVISRQEYKGACFALIILISFQLIFSYYAIVGKITDVLFYLVTFSILDLLMVSSVIINNFILKDPHIPSTIAAILAIFCTLLSIFDFYEFYYLQYTPMFIMEYLYFSIKSELKFSMFYYLFSSLLVVPHIIT